MFGILKKESKTSMGSSWFRQGIIGVGSSRLTSSSVKTPINGTNRNFAFAAQYSLILSAIRTGDNLPGFWSFILGQGNTKRIRNYDSYKYDTKISQDSLGWMSQMVLAQMKLYIRLNCSALHWSFFGHGFDSRRVHQASRLNAEISVVQVNYRYKNKKKNGTLKSAFFRYGKEKKWIKEKQKMHQIVYVKK